MEELQNIILSVKAEEKKKKTNQGQLNSTEYPFQIVNQKGEEENCYTKESS